MNIFQKIAIGIVGVAISLLLYVIIILIYPFKTIEAVQPFVVVTPTVEAGSKLVYHAEFKVYTDKEFDVEWELIDSKNPTFPIIIPQHGRLHIPKGQHKVNREVIIPIETPPGKYRVRVSDKVQLFTFRSVEKIFITGEFSVVEPKEQ